MSSNKRILAEINIYRSNIVDTLQKSEIELWNTFPNRILEHINSLDDRLKRNKINLLLAYKLTECIQLFDNTRIFVLFSCYSTAARELRYMIETLTQAYYIDINHMNESLKTKREIYKALTSWGGFIGGTLFNKSKLPNKSKLKGLYKELSEKVHGSYDEIKDLTTKPIYEATVTKYSKKNLEEITRLGSIVCDEIIKVNTTFQNKFLEE